MDLDPQASLTLSMGCREPDRLEHSVTEVISGIVNDEELSEDFGIIHVKDRLDLLPSNINLSAAEVSLVNVMSRELVLRIYMEQIRSRYDYILIDCMPSLGILTVNALACADSVLIPVQAAYLPVKGLQQLIKTIYTVKRRLNKTLTRNSRNWTRWDFQHWVWKNGRRQRMEYLSRLNLTAHFTTWMPLISCSK